MRWRVAGSFHASLAAVKIVRVLVIALLAVLLPLRGAPAWVGSVHVGTASFPPYAAAAPTFILDGVERPPRTR